MNQNEQMREALRDTQDFLTECEITLHLDIAQLRILEDKIKQALAAEPAPNTLGYVQGIEAAAKMLDTKAADYAGEFGFGDMGGLEFSREAHREYHSTLIELAEEVRAMLGTQPAPLVRLTEGECRGIFIKNGFTIKEGQTDLKPYVFAAANALQDAWIAKNGGSNVM